MKKLFVIGNGFDCYLHDLPTKYSNFRTYLLSRFPHIEEYYMIPGSTQMPKGEEVYDEEEVAGYVISILNSCGGDEWSNLESYLGADVFDFIEENLPKVTLEDESYKDVYLNEDLSRDIKETFVTVKKLFAEWVNEELSTLNYIPLSNVADIIEGDNYFLNFNYTYTLEEAYGIKEVCHIHGQIGNEPDAIYFGHGDDEDYPESLQTMGAEDALGELKRDLRKDTMRALAENKSFFERLDDVEVIYSFGFSFSEVDRVYLDRISKKVKPGTIWYFNSYAWDEAQAGKTDYLKVLEVYDFEVKVENRW
ncbi:MAG: bacteriophage abortive infection AbiH family protein [Lachnospiraceae bacterium]|nr:bacteriophage abortive infection AbiH family protein [Lachnospiraceae bacterium]